jgi:hypothetical protein
MKNIWKKIALFNIPIKLYNGLVIRDAEPFEAEESDIPKAFRKVFEQQVDEVVAQPQEEVVQVPEIEEEKLIRRGRKKKEEVIVEEEPIEEGFDVEVTKPIDEE